jgi:hypothetical protein
LIFVPSSGNKFWCFNFNSFINWRFAVQSLASFVNGLLAVDL